MMLFATLIMKLLVKTRNEAMFAHCAARRNIIYAVNIIAEGDIIGQSPYHLPERANIISKRNLPLGTFLFD